MARVIRPRHPASLLGRALLRLAQAMVGGRPLPLNFVRGIRRFLAHENALLPSPRRLRSRGSSLRDPVLSRVLSSEELGSWALDADSISFLEAEIKRRRPRVILEFGSGVSTVCLARFISRFCGEGRIFSVEQDRQHMAKTSKLLEDANLSNLVEMVHSPVVWQYISGRHLPCYDIRNSNLADAMSDAQAEFVLIDGPAAGSGARFGTLELARPFVVDTARYCLDDGLRDDELAIASQWEKLEGIEVAGIQVIGKGLTLGTVRGSSANGRAGPEPSHNPLVSRERCESN